MEWNKTKTNKLVTTIAYLREVVSILDKATLIAVDAETTGINRFDEVVGLGFAVSEDEAYYVPLQVWSKTAQDGVGSLIIPWTESAYAEVKSSLISQLTKSKRLIGHNSPFDAKVIANSLGVQTIDYFIADTALLHHTAISEDPPHSLKTLAAKFLDPDAINPQDDLKASVIANGGKWNKTDKEMCKGDYDLLGRYCNYDVLYTFGLYNRFYPEVAALGLTELWEREVMPLNKVTYELNTCGVRVDIPYFEKLKEEMQTRINIIDDEIYALIEDKVVDYEYKRVLEDVNITSRSQLGKHLVKSNVNIEDTSSFLLEPARSIITEWFKKKKGVTRVFNFDSGDDKAFLLYDVLELPCETITESGKRSVNKIIIDRLIEDYEDDAPVLKLLKERSKEVKILGTYVEPILEGHINGRVYAGFNQSGTTAGRFSSSGVLNLQTLPRNDKRIKKGFLADEGYVFVNADFSSLEPRAFAHVSDEDSIKAVYKNGLDLYCQVAIQVMGLKGVSAKEGDKNYLKDVDPDMRQLAKTITLAIPYGASAARISQILSKELKKEVTYEEATEIYSKYMKAFPKLKGYMDKCNFQICSKGYVKNLTGRIRRGPLVSKLWSQGLRDFSKKEIRNKFNKLKGIHDVYFNADDLYYACRTQLNNSCNFPIQSLAASITNAAMVQINQEAAKYSLDCKVMLQVHDELTLLVKKEHAPRAVEFLKKAMEDNWVAKKISVPMKADPVVCTNLADSK